MSEKILQVLDNSLNATTKSILVGYSGGVDSHVLLHALTRIRQVRTQLDFKAVHIHHGLLREADQWVRHCEKVCNDLKVPCQVVYVSVKPIPGESLEALARKKRYRAFAELITPQDVLLTAHHLDDQAETCLLQFLRGSGTKGLSAMASVIQFSQGKLIRPFLSVSRQEILDYANHYQLHWIEDNSNHDVRFTRNFLRHQIMPALKDRWPNVAKTIKRVSQHCLETEHLLKELAEQDLNLTQGNQAQTLSVEKMRQLSPARQKNVLRKWLYRLGFPLPSTIKLQHVLKDVIYARSDAQSCVGWQETEIRRYRDDIYVMKPIILHDSTLTLSWDCMQPLSLPANMGTLLCQQTVGEGIKITQRPLTVRFRQGGETCRLKNRSNEHTLKKLFQEWHIPPWKRDRIPLIFIDSQLAAIVGYAICEEFIVQEKEKGHLIELTK